ncbi:VOC family protein [Saezia sanguinis]|uniref:VOC family protein n=1 Tax=Saezia sanguinis TaxID=1965230 RepID=UPI00305AECA0
MATVNIYLLFNGNCEQAFDFYRSVFGGEFPAVIRYGDVPLPPEAPSLPENTRHKIENISLPISQETMLMGADAVGHLAAKTVFGNNFSVYIEAASHDEAYRLFNGLAQNGHIAMPLSQAHWGDEFGMLTDQFGINWLINHSPNKTTA